MKFMRCLFVLLAVALASCSGGSGIGSLPAPDPPKMPHWIAIQFVDRAGVTLHPTHSKGGNCWPIDSPPYPIPAHIPLKKYKIYGLVYNAPTCGAVSSISFEVKYGPRKHPHHGCNTEISYDGGTSSGYRFTFTPGATVTCTLKQWVTGGGVNVNAVIIK